ncbi:MAG: hypothetical protein NC082_02295 [Clostridiales bacterium]|nr:hypothetical protein [Clostridiales bacterium]
MNLLKNVICGMGLLSCGIITAGAKDLEIYDGSGQLQGKIENVSALSFTEGKITAHSANGIQPFELSNAIIKISSNGTSGVDAVESQDMKVSMSGGVLTVVADKEIDKLNVFNPQGIQLATISPNASTCMLNVNSTSAILLIQVEIGGESKIVKLVNK